MSPYRYGKDPSATFIGEGEYNSGKVSRVAVDRQTDCLRVEAAEEVDCEKYLTEREEMKTPLQVAEMYGIGSFL